MVMSPELRRPPERLRTANSGLCGLSFVRSPFTSEVLNLSVGVAGLYVLIAIVFFLEEPPAIGYQFIVLNQTSSTLSLPLHFSPPELKAES
jgi:hypothetical protein